MKIQGEEEYPHPRELVWRALLDPEILSRTLPGCEDLKEVGEHQYAGKLKMKVGPVQGVFQGGVVLGDLRELEGYSMKIDGKGAPGFMNGEGTLELEECNGGAATLLRYDIDAQVGGRIASVGQRLLDSSAKVITKQGLAGLGRQLEALAQREAAAGGAGGSDDASALEVAPGAAAASSPGNEPAAPPPARDPGVPDTEKLPRDQLPDSGEFAQAPSQAAFAKEFAKEMAKELVPKRSRPALLIAAVLFVVALVALYLRAC